MKKNTLKAPQGKYLVVIRSEDLDTVDPGPDSTSKETKDGTKDVVIDYAKSLYVPGSIHTTVYDDKGEKIYSSP